jgi:hypothetical protein
MTVNTVVFISNVAMAVGAPITSHVVRTGGPPYRRGKSARNMRETGRVSRITLGS